jgi:peroxiredoxin
MTLFTVLALTLGGAVSLEAGAKGFSFNLKDVSGKSHSLKSLDSSKAVAIIWVSTRCPISNAYNKRMEELNKQYKDKGIVFVGINSNKTESVEEIKKHAAENKFSFPILKDDNNVIADQYEATVTPEVYMLSNGKLLYHGRIDDSRREDKVTSKDFINAMNEVLAGKAVAVNKTKAFGCTIKRIKK